jgi:hypothetical protein
MWNNNFALQQCSEENPLTFLQHLKDAIKKHTTVDPELQVREVLLEDKFLIQSVPDIRKKFKVCGWRRKVIESSNTASHFCIYSYVCMSWTLLTGERKIRDTMASLLISQRAPPDWGLHPELATMVDRRCISAEDAQKGGQHQCWGASE